MIIIRIPQIFLLTLIAVVITGCASTQTFSTVARAGDTVALAVGWQKTLSRDNVRVIITPASGSPVVYQANDPAVRGIINLYPDPVSNLVIGTNLNDSLGVDATTIGSGINQYVTGNDRDWWQTTMFLDLPSTLSTGTARITIKDAAMGTIIQSSNVEIVPGTGTPNDFRIYVPGGTTVDSLSINLTSSGVNSGGFYSNALLSLERAQHLTLSFDKPASSTPCPQALQVQLSHDPAINQSWVSSPRGDIKNVNWRDDGATITLLITAASDNAIADMKDLNVYIAGPVTGLAVVPDSLRAYDANGDVITGVTTALTQ